MMLRLEAALVALAVPLAVRSLPLRVTLRICDYLPRQPRSGEPSVLAAMVRRRLGRGPWVPDCLTSAVAAYALLRRRGHRVRVHIGVRGFAAAFTAHAWLSVDGRALVDPFAPAGSYRELFGHGD